jgi:hypothetical protein
MRQVQPSRPTECDMRHTAQRRPASRGSRLRREFEPDRRFLALFTGRGTRICDPLKIAAAWAHRPADAAMATSSRNSSRCRGCQNLQGVPGRSQCLVRGRVSTSSRCGAKCRDPLAGYPPGVDHPGAGDDEARRVAWPRAARGPPADAHRGIEVRLRSCRNRLAPRPPCDLGSSHRGGGPALGEGPDFLGDGAPVGGGGELAEYREQAQVDALKDHV